MISDENRCVESRVDAGHHAQLARPGADHAHVVRKLVDQKVLAVTVRIGDQDFGRSCIFRAVNGGHCFPCHEISEALVFECPGRELIAGSHARDALHVDRNVDFQFRALRCERQRSRGGGCAHEKSAA